MTEQRLTDIMEFDHVIRVRPDGSIEDTNGEARRYWAPELRDGALDSEEWELLDGYSGQDRYSGPIMHNSEFIFGRMERDIRERPGVYVSLICYWESDAEGVIDPDEDYIEGWAVARLRDEFDPDHDHVWGTLESSRLAGTVHRKCEVDGCRVVSALDDEDEEAEDEFSWSDASALWQSQHGEPDSDRTRSALTYLREHLAERGES